MSNAIVRELRPVDLAGALEELKKADGRLQMVYAWYPEASDDAEVRYVATLPSDARMVQWAVRPDAGELPSLSDRAPMLGWYERELMEMTEVRFTDHPQPERLVTAHVPEDRLPHLRKETLNGRDATIPVSLPEPQLPVVSGRHVQLLPFGPVRADVLESAQFIFYYVGEGILHYHPELFLKHRGMEAQFEGQDPAGSVLIAERVSGVGSVAHAIACAQAIEDAAMCVVPQRGRLVRLVIAELERVYNHLHYLGHLCHTTTLKVGEAEGKLLEENAKQLNARASGSRFLRSVVCPGGVRRDIDVFAIAEGLARIRPEIDRYIELLGKTTSHLDRLISTAPLSRELALDQGASGPIERASGVDRDMRRDHPYGAYDHLTVPVITHADGDAYARMKVRIGELGASIELIDKAIGMMNESDQALRAPCNVIPGSEGIGWSESPRGAVIYAAHFDREGRVARMKIKSPSYSNWSAFRFTVHDSNMMDYAINEASFGLTVAGCAR